MIAIRARTAQRSLNVAWWGGLALTGGVGWLLATLPVGVAAGAVAGAIALTLLVIHPFFGLALAWLVGPLGAWETTAVGLPLPSGQLVLWVTLLAWLARSIVLRRRIVLPATPLNRWLLLFVAVAAAGLWQVESTWDGIKELGKWVEILLVMWLVLDAGVPFFDNGRVPPARRRWLLAVLVAALLLPAVGQALLGFWQFALRGTGPDHMLISGDRYRAFGTFQQPNPFGGYMSLNLSLALGTALGVLLWGVERLRVVGRKGWDSAELLPILLRLSVGLLVTGGTAAVLALGLVASWSRGAWLGFIGGVGVIALFLPRHRRTGILLLVGGGVLLWVALQSGLLPAAIVDRLIGFLADFRVGDVRGVDINDLNFSVIERLAHWQVAVEMAREQLWIGVGFGNYEATYSQYALLNWPNALGHAHNYYLNLLAETGVWGLAAYVALWSAVIVETVRAIDRTSWPVRGIALGLLAAWTGMGVHHLLDNLYVNNLFVHLGGMFGLLLCLRRGAWDAVRAADATEAAGRG